ncbi:MAG: N-acetylmuramoyl-L-alanine amidase [Flavipsychrobacter sp.]
MRIKLLLIILSCCISPQLLFANGKKVTKIVLDAGHGGQDGGARGNFSNEKDLALAVTMKLGKMIAENMKDVEVIYTRTTDVYPSLVTRHEIANKAGADLFVSIHINSTAGTKTRVRAGYRTIKGKDGKTYRRPRYRTVYNRNRNTNAAGTMCLVLGLHRSSQKEDAIGEYGDNVVDEPGLLNPDDPQTAIIISQYTQAFLNRSVSVATKIQNNFIAQGRGDYGVKQQGLEVLAGSAMPGVLVEIGFVNNPEEETYMNSVKGQNEIVDAIFRGIREYKKEVEGN